MPDQKNPFPDAASRIDPVFDTPLSPEEIEAAQAAAGAEAVDPAQHVPALLAKISELNDQLLRAQAEVQNTRRRTDEEIAKVRKFALESFAESLLAVVDSLEAALQVESATAQQLHEGTVATHRQLMGALERHKLVEINPAAGARFDPTQQQAISMVPSDQEPNTVVSVLQKGYLLSERVLRPALVTVAAPQ